MADAAGTTVREPTAMALATVDADGSPSVRMVLMRGLDERGLCFYTNRGSAKGLALAAHPRAAVVLYWDPLERQVRVTGDVERLSPEESEAYFTSRPLGSRLAAWASDQSRPIADRAALEARVAEATARFADGDVPLPPDWGGYRIVPDMYEFWSGRPDRLHDRCLYTRDGSGWRQQRLMP